MKTKPLNRDLGSLTRAHNLILGDEKTNNAVFTLDHWTQEPSGSAKSYPNLSRRRRLTHNRARLLLIRVQESTLNFLFRWLLLEETGRLSGSWCSPEELKQTQRRKETYRRKTRSSLLLNDVPLLPDKRPTSVIKFVFWRWLTWTNLFELLLIILMVSCCIFQCYELLEDYYSYPTHVSITKKLNDDFRTDLPAITLCNNNRLSKETMKLKFPKLNETHYMAMTLGTFYSVDNFTLTPVNNDNPNEEETNISNIETGNITTTSTAAPMQFNSDDINWGKVIQYLSNDTVSGIYNLLPDYDLIDTLTCANVWGQHMPCQRFKRIASIHEGCLCFTLFHDSVLWDHRDPVVHELETAIINNPSTMRFGDHVNDDGMQLLNLNDSELIMEVDKNVDEEKVRVEVANMEMLRLRINFRAKDYLNKRSVVGGFMAVHSNSVMDAVTNQLVWKIEPSYWYTHYIERFDYRRLPPPYDTNCYDYEQSRYVWLDRQRWIEENRPKILELIRKQVASPNKLVPEYVDNLRQRSLGGRECMSTCGAELPAIKCNCWPRGVPYMRHNNIIDINSTMRWCQYDTLLREHSNSSDVAGPDLYFQLCGKDFSLPCVAACPDECNFSSFDITRQSRSWPSHEARRYITDSEVLGRLKQEADCCATVSVIYAAPASSQHMTEPKYSRQDMVTIISGNIEAWIGLSAVHAYLFLEQFYDALVEARLISPLSVCNRRVSGCLLISILTNLEDKISQLFTYLFHQLARLYLFLNKHQQ